MNIAKIVLNKPKLKGKEKPKNLFKETIYKLCIL
jgi:hypothetical protein